MKFEAKTLGYLVAGLLTMIALSTSGAEFFVPAAILIGMPVFIIWGLAVHGGSDIPKSKD